MSWINSNSNGPISCSTCLGFREHPDQLVPQEAVVAVVVSKRIICHLNLTHVLSKDLLAHQDHQVLPVALVPSVP